MRLISDDILIDSGQENPFFDLVYPMLGDFQFSNPSAWTEGHPFGLYREMQEKAPIMWSSPYKNRGKVSGFWCVTKYEDIKKEVHDLEFYDCKDFLEAAEIIQASKLD